MKPKIILVCNLLTGLILLSGCGPQRVIYNQTNFVLEASRDREQQKVVDEQIVLDVYNFNIDRAFSGKSLVYRKSETIYETDFYNKFLISPDDMITEKTRGWLSESGLFKTVTEPGSYVEATHALQGSIIELYGDFRTRSSSKAVMKTRYYVVDLSDKSVVFNKSYEAQVNAKDNTAASIVQALGQCLVTILTELEADLAAEL